MVFKFSSLESFVISKLVPNTVISIALNPLTSYYSSQKD